MAPCQGWRTDTGCWEASFWDWSFLWSYWSVLTNNGGWLPCIPFKVSFHDPASEYTHTHTFTYSSVQSNQYLIMWQETSYKRWGLLVFSGEDKEICGDQDFVLFFLTVQSWWKHRITLCSPVLIRWMSGLITQPISLIGCSIVSLCECVFVCLIGPLWVCDVALLPITNCPMKKVYSVTESLS